MAHYPRSATRSFLASATGSVRERIPVNAPRRDAAPYTAMAGDVAHQEADQHHQIVGIVSAR
jgi:hypothetical protein